MMRELADVTQKQEFLRHMEPRWSGTVVYRTLIPSAPLAARMPKHPLLSVGQVVRFNILHMSEIVS